MWFWTSRASAYGDDFEGQPAQGAFYQWGLGVVLALGVAGYGVMGLVTGHAVFEGGHQWMELTGASARGLGVAAVSLGVFLHCHYFWGNVYDGIWFAVLGKILAGVGFIGGLGVMIVRVGILGSVTPEDRDNAKRWGGALGNMIGINERGGLEARAPTITLSPFQV